MKQGQSKVVLDACTQIFVRPYNLRISISGNSAHGYEFTICVGDVKKCRTLIHSRRFILSDTVDSMIDKVEKLLIHICTTVGDTFLSLDGVDDLMRDCKIEDFDRSDFLTSELIVWIVAELKKEKISHIRRADTWEYKRDAVAAS